MKAAHALLAIAAAVGCRGRSPAERPVPREPIANVATAVERAAPAVEPAASIYDLPIELRDASGDAIGLDVGRGHPVLIAMFYASCPVACPVLTEELKQILAEAPPDVRVMLVSFDPARDTPEKLRALIAERALDARWTVAAAAEPDARALAAVLGVKYRRLDSGEFFHSATIVALDADGRPFARVDTLGQRATIVAALGR